MAETEFALNDPLVVDRFSRALANEAYVDQYSFKFMGEDEASMIKVQKELEKKAGETITVGLAMKLTGDGIEGDNVIKGTNAEEAINFFHDKVYIDQRRKGTKTKGRMTQQRVPYKLRKVSKDKLVGWFAEDYDQQFFCYLSGARGIDTSLHFPLDWTGRANNSLQVPDSDHLLYGGDATAKADLDSSDTMSLSIVERLNAHLETVDPQMLPFRIEGSNKFVLLMHTFQAYSLRTSTTTNDWVDIQKYVGDRGKKNKLYQDSLGEFGGMILHKHRNVIRFNDYGSGGDVEAARALCLGAQAGMIAWGGDGGKNRYTWNEETDDRGNQLAVTAGSIYGIKKSRYNGKDYGVVAVDTYATNPNA